MAIKLELEIKEAELVVAGLYKLPMEVAEQIVVKIKTQAIPQIAEQQEAEKAKVVDTAKADPLPEEPQI
jgi:hypothetical protein